MAGNLIGRWEARDNLYAMRRFPMSAEEEDAVRHWREVEAREEWDEGPELERALNIVGRWTSPGPFRPRNAR